MLGDDWPALDYSREALAGFGERELLGFLLSIVAPPDEAQRLSARLMRQFGTLAKVVAAAPSEYQHEPGASAQVATLLALLSVTVEKVLEPRPDRRRRFARPDQVKAYFAKRLPVPANRVRVLFLDQSHRFIADETLPNLFARDVVGRALVLNACHLVLVGRDDGLFQRIQDVGGPLQVHISGFIRDGPKPTAAQIAGRLNRETVFDNPLASSQLPWTDARL